MQECKHPLMLAAATFLIMMSQSSLRAQDKYVTEDGITYNLTSGEQPMVTDVGAFVCKIPFASTVIDYTTGAFVVPKYEICYSLTPTAWTPADHVAGNIQWVFSDQFGEISTMVLSFDSQTGVGEAKVILPCNLFTNQSSWGQLWGGQNRLRVYHGLPGSLDWTPLSEPTQYEGVKEVVFSAAVPDISLSFPENRGMKVDRETILCLVAKDTWQTDRTFSLNTTPGFFSGPFTVVLPAGEHMVEASYFVSEAGDGYLYAESASYPGVNFKSQMARAIDEPESFAVVVGPAGGEGVIEVEPGNHEMAGSSKRCVHFEASGPGGASGDQAIAFSYSGCSRSPQPDCAIGQVPGDGVGRAWYQRSDCKWTYNIFSWCNWYSYGKDIEKEATAWELVDVQLIPCGSVGAAIGWMGGSPGPTFEINGEIILHKAVCTWIIQTETTITLKSDDCNS